MQDYKVIEAFILVMRNGSVTAAENATGVPKATLNRHLARLEESLGVQLFVRSARKSVPTEAARDFYKNCVRLIDDMEVGLEEARASVRDLSDGVCGHLTIVSTSHLATSYVGHILRKYVGRHPNVVCHMDLVSDSSTALGNDIDCYVCSSPRDDLDLAARLLGHLRYRFFASSDYIRTFGEPAAPAELCQHRSLVLGQQSADVTVRHDSTGEEDQCNLRVIASSNDYWVVKTMAIRGHGIAILPEFFAHNEVESGLLQPVLAAWQAPRVPVYCMYQRQRYMGRKLRAFIDLMVESFDRIESLQYYTADRPTKAG
ncbi:HTH-type transcriptional regulator PgrR [Paraburkholderia domus]|jgi:Transcriptional regulator|uniref:HTH-type transcriptional regulator PgrR n=1 Tax=Paraburkholderia domus TaxID=2793075 RepID=A0A9N8MK47_9BURK|nr:MULTISPECIES: LysR family transcriptional regulator [Paraburkholderia]MBK5053606.1 LysR family transcriptional regulator [Burkholderia sp. R-70006]MBK5064889.1 LysR family transcriptional regulator [Burkholderia sp. R-70199]MBK5090876.1 LysR family transcriptional regulator [Burkholderia sp. R-69927]MBK5125647.1 LysR family transcriptional regulator [Burkholderia sp. R-69980]MBK5168517.1 LysR family transcriptional regulator [Burkholderia sp. R-70211]MBK5183826.1 LysR family transcriptiona